MTDFATILDEAHKAAKAAVIAKGPENMRALDCGFAWVVIGGREPLANYCRKEIKNRVVQAAEYVEVRKFGDKGYPSGWQWWCPGEFHGQAIGHHEAGAAAFRDVLAKYGIRADLGSRLD